MAEVREGRAVIQLPWTHRGANSVFYNKVQEFNRDLTINIISLFAEEHIAEKCKKSWISQSRYHVFDSSCNQLLCNDDNTSGVIKQDGIRIFEGLSASGLRSIRFALEIPHVKEVIANDIDKHAVEIIQKNIEINDLADIVTASCADASAKMHQYKGHLDRFDVIDIDPYGSAAEFMDSAVQAVCDGGLLCVTCTDAAVLCGNVPEVCYAKYGSVSLHTKYAHEMGLRIILHALNCHANRYGRYIVPLVALKIDFYFRVFVRVYTSLKNVQLSITKASYVYHCVGCGSYVLQAVGRSEQTKGNNKKYLPGYAPQIGMTCCHCDHKYIIGGPIWSDALHDIDFVAGVLHRVACNYALFATSKRISGMLSLVSEELFDVPLFYILDDICKRLHCSTPNFETMRSALLNAGYRVSFSHAKKNSYKTDAPGNVIWDIMRTWVQHHPVSESRLAKSTVAKAILSREPILKISFEPHPDANPLSRQKGLLRWQINPEPGWGPKPRAGRLCCNSQTTMKSDCHGAEKNNVYDKMSIP